MVSFKVRAIIGGVMASLAFGLLRSSHVALLDSAASSLVVFLFSFYFTSQSFIRDMKQKSADNVEASRIRQAGYDFEQGRIEAQRETQSYRNIRNVVYENPLAPGPLERSFFRK